MKLVREEGADVGSGVEQVALVLTASAAVEFNCHRADVGLGPVFVFSGPRMPPGAVMPACGCNPYAGHMIARSIEDARRLRDALDRVIARAEGAGDDIDLVVTGAGALTRTEEPS